MMHASALDTPQNREAVERAVASAEARTSAQIVPVIATASGRYDRAEDVAGLLLGAIAMSVLWLVLPREVTEPGSWGGLPAGLEWLAYMLALVGGFLLGAVLAMRIAPLRRMFTPPRQMVEETLLRAHQAFFDARVRETRGRTGVLIYVSLYERRAVILADDAALAALTPPAVEEMCTRLTETIGKSGVIPALVQAIESAGERLAKPLPATAGQANEIANRLVVLD